MKQRAVQQVFAMQKKTAAKAVSGCFNISTGNNTDTSEKYYLFISAGGSPPGR